jgi:hypothetical protein
MESMTIRVLPIGANKRPKAVTVCKECQKECQVVDGKILRDCGHDDAPVIGMLSATCYGVGSARIGAAR